MKILRQPGDHPHKPLVLLCAFTGKAASLVNGQTIHTSFDFKFGTAHLPLSDKKRAMMRDLLSELKIVVIDELSLVEADMLYRIHMRLCEVFQSEDMFAGKSIILVGDLMQLQPVQGTFIFKKPVNPHFGAYFDVQSLWHSFKPYLLTHCHRQGDGSAWASILNELRVGRVTDEAERLLQTRVTTNPFLEQDALHVMYTHKEVNAHNDKMLDSLKGPEVELLAIKRGPIKHPFRICKKQGTVDKTQFVDKLKLKVGARVKLTVNVSTVDELVNGALGTVIAFETNQKKKIEAVIVAFDNELCGRAQRSSYPTLSQKYKKENGTPIFMHELEYHIPSVSGKPQAARAKVCQFPLRLAWANTAHTMQGVTVKAGSKLVVHWQPKFKEGMAYVMLGRCERIQDIFIAGEFNSSYIKCSKDALAESRRLEEIVHERTASEVMDENSVLVGYLNVQSLPAHFEDFKCLLGVQKLDLVVLGETWLHPGQKYELDGWESTFENGGKGKGLAVYSRFGKSTTVSHTEEKVSVAKVTNRGIDYIFLYLSKGFEWILVHQILEDLIDSVQPTVVMGDVNWDWNSNKPMKSYFLKRGFSQEIDSPTHEDGNILDHLYLSKPFEKMTFEVKQQSVHFSDHDLITLYIKGQ